MTSFWPPVDRTAAAFVAPNATVMGYVTLGEQSSIWYGAVVRGDVERIEIGAFSNVQDGAIIHGDPGIATVIGNYVTIGHRAVIHSAFIEEGCLIGMGAIVLDGVRIGAGSIVGAGAVVTKDVEARSMMVGVPAKLRHTVSVEAAADLIVHAQKYAKLAAVHAGTGEDLGFTLHCNK